MVVGVAISAWSIWQLAQAVRPDEVGRHLGGASWLLLALSFLSIPVSMLLKCVRWRYLFPQQPAPGLRPLLAALYIGYLMNTVLPARIGEFARAYLVGRDPRIGVPAVLATIVVEKILDLLTLGVVLAGLVVFQQLPSLPGWLQVSAITSAAGLLGALVVLGIMLSLRKQVVRLAKLAEARVPLLERVAVAALASSFLDGLSTLGRRQTLPGVVVWSAMVWASSTVTMWLDLVGIGLYVSTQAILFSLVVTNLGMAVPSAPGYIGVFHQLVVESLLPFGVDRDQALAAAIVMHAIVFGNFVVGGLWLLWRGGYSLRGLRDASGH